MRSLAISDLPPRLVLRITRPRNRQELPPGVDFEVRGTVLPPAGEFPSQILSVSVRIGDAAPVQAALVPPSGPRGPTRFSATVQLPGPGVYRLRVFATDEGGLEASAS